MSNRMNTRTNTVLRAAGVSVVLGGATILDSVHLEVYAGELLALVGPNGAGKSTLLGVLSGDVEPKAGHVELRDRPIRRQSAGDLARQRAMLLQEQRLAFPFRVVDVVRMGRHPWAGRPEEDHDEQRVASAMATCDVLPMASRAFPSLSGGEKARTSFARVLAQEVGVLLLDEPTASLDVLHQEKVLRTARDCARNGDAVVVVLHDLSLAAAYADRVCLLDQGRVAAHGSPEDVLRADLLAGVYGHPIDVLRHPRTGELLVLPDRRSVS